MTIKSQKDWWDAVEGNWSDLIGIGERFCPLYEQRNLRGETTVGKTLLQHVEEYRMKKDWESLWLFFQKAWGTAPDDLSIHFIPSWNILCDLCSETWVFDVNKDITEKICENCVYLKRRNSTSIYMNGTEALNVWCSYMKDGIYVKGKVKLKDKCDNFAEGENAYNILSDDVKKYLV